MSTFRLSAVSFVLAVALAPRTFAAQGGRIDPTFHVGLGFNVAPSCVAVDAQGGVLVGGAFLSYNGVQRNRIARLFPDGTLDLNFDPLAGPNATVLDIEVQSDGKIMIVGDFTTYRSLSRPAVARLLPNGSPDLTFQPAFVSTAPPVFALERQNDGKYLLGGVFDMFGGAVHRRLARLDSLGAVDGTYNAGADDHVYCLALQTDGKALVGGLFTQLLGLPQQHIGRFDSSGALDSSFVGQANDEVDSICVQTDGKVLIGGFFTSYGGTPANHVARLSPNGQLDATFQSDPGANGPVWSVAQDGAGRVLVGGSFTQVAGTLRRGLARLESDGTLDATFAPLSGPNGTVLDIALQSDGRILIVGTFGAYDSIPSRGIARVIADGSCYVDADGDGHGTGPAIAGNGPCGPGYSGLNDDCDDLNASVFAGAPELCDGFDNDCDGEIDEGFQERYCTPGVSFDGCVATMSGVGVPSASNSSGFQLLASGAPGRRLGLFYYGFQPGFVAVSIDSTSYFCALPPYQRMSTVLSSGTAGQCNGVFSLDFNQWLQANPTAVGSPMLPGTVIYAQAWYRDPRVRDRANLSDGLKFTICN